jgi:Domain of unknown function (DUF4411)
MAYLLDANVFIQAKNLHYGLDFCPAFWDWLVEKNRRQEVFSVERVEDELLGGADELAAWAGKRGKQFFLEPDKKVASALASVSQWVTSQEYEPSAINTFLQIADYYLVAHALAHGHMVVTHEIPAASTRKVKIPNACIGLGIKCINPYQMLRREQARFVLGGGARGK